MKKLIWVALPIILVAVLLGALIYFVVLDDSDEEEYDYSESYDNVRECYPINSSIPVNPSYNMECCNDAEFVEYDGNNEGVYGYCIDKN